MLKQSDQKQSIKVAIRVRPILDKYPILKHRQFNDDVRTCIKVEDKHLHLISGSQIKKFAFDHICFNQSQQQIFEKLGKKCAKDCLQGYNCTIFAYGQTGAGKTYTMMGLDFDHEKYFENRGLIPRTIEFLFKCIRDQQEKGVNFIIKSSYLQIYNEQIIDLLNKSNSNLQLREDIKKGVYVEGISSQIVTKTEEAINILEKGSKSRHVSSTLYNETSSRSHSVFSLDIESKFTKNGVSNIKCRQFNFIDLAGSQRTKLSTGERLREGCNINKSLMNLSSVINALSEASQGKIQHINYRNSKLTFLLKDSLGGNSKTNLIANIHPAGVFYQQTLSTLGFARRAKLVKRSKALINEDSSGSLQSMKKQIKRLNQQLINFISNSHNSSFDSKTIEQKPSKITSFMSEFIDQEIDKQTRFQNEILRLTKRISHLQEGIKQYNNNQIHLKMIISVYQDKISRLKKIEENLNSKITNLDQTNQQSKSIIQYFKNQRNNLIKLVQSAQLQSQRNQYFKQILQQAKMIKQDDNDGVLRDILLKNTDYLAIINSKLNQMKREPTILQSQPQMNKRFQQIKKQFYKRQEQLQERVDQANIELSQYKNRIEQNQKLLQESVNNQIILQQKVKQLQSINFQLSNKVIHQERNFKQQNKLLKQQLCLLKDQNQNLKLKNKDNLQKLELFASRQLQYQQQLQKINDRIIQISKIDNQQDQNNAKQLQILNAIISECNKKMNQYKQYYQSQLHNCNKLKQDNDYLKKEIIQMKLAIKQAKQQADLFKQKINHNKKQMSKLSLQNKEQSQIKQELKSKIIVFSQQIVSMRQKLEKNQRQIILLNDLLSKKEAQLKSMQQSRQSSQNLLIQNRKLNTNLQESLSLIKELTIQNCAIKEKLLKYDTYHRKISKQLEDLYSYKQKRETEMDELDRVQQKIIEQISLKQAIFKELTRQKESNLAMKQNIQKLTQQYNKLKQQTQQLQNSYQKLLEKSKNQQNQHRKSTTSQHYLKTIQLLEKSRTEHIELKRQNDEIKKVMFTLKETVTQKQAQNKQIQYKYNVNLEKLQKKLDKLEKDYSQLNNSHQKLKKQKKSSEKISHDNQNLKYQIKQIRSSAQKIAQKNSEIQMKIKKANLNSLRLQRQYEQIKRSDSLTLASEDKSRYVHKLKAQIALLKTQRALLTQSLNKERQQRIRLKQQIKYGSSDTKMKLQLEKKFNQNKNLTQFIFEIINQLKICVTQPKAKLEVIRNLILGKIKQIFQEVKILKEEIKRIQNTNFMHGPIVNDFTPSKQSRQLKTINISSNQRFTTQQNSYKYNKYKDTASYFKNFSSQNMREFQKFNARLKYNENQTKKRSFE